MEQYTVSVIIPAAGSSSRMKGVNKLKSCIGGMPVLARTLLVFEHSHYCDEIVIVAPECDMAEFSAMAEKYGVTKLRAVVPGGATRQQSVARGVAACSGEADLFCIHDGARPFVTEAVIESTVRAAVQYGAAATAVPVKDTVKLSSGNFIEGTPDRDTLFACQTPQVFRRENYLEAMAAAAAAGVDYTDDCQLIEAAGGSVRICLGDYRNIKITTAEDLLVAEAFAGGENTMQRIGQGYDVHRLVEGRPLILGGVSVPYERGLLGHSDADVLAHAVMDALLGAAGLDDIGAHFPDTDEKYKGADSLGLLRECVRLISERGFAPYNLDCTIIAQMPKLRPFIAQMRVNLAAACGLSEDRINVKATTEEGLGFTGSGEGIAASASALIISK